jgi:hypothetical protein
MLQHRIDPRRTVAGSSAAAAPRKARRAPRAAPCGCKRRCGTLQQHVATRSAVQRGGGAAAEADRVNAASRAALGVDRLDLVQFHWCGPEPLPLTPPVIPYAIVTLTSTPTPLPLPVPLPTPSPGMQRVARHATLRCGARCTSRTTRRVSRHAACRRVACHAVGSKSQLRPRARTDTRAHRHTRTHARTRAHRHTRTHARAQVVAHCGRLEARARAGGGGASAAAGTPLITGEYRGVPDWDHLKSTA